MTEDEQINRRIFKAHEGKTVVEFRAGYTCAEDEAFRCPQYTKDLNAIRPVVMELNSSENDAKGRAVAFCKALEEIQEEDSCCWIECAVPSAQQLCRAYLRAPEREEWQD